MNKIEEMSGSWKKFLIEIGVGRKTTSNLLSFMRWRLIEISYTQFVIRNQNFSLSAQKMRVTVYWEIRKHGVMI